MAGGNATGYAWVMIRRESVAQTQGALRASALASILAKGQCTFAQLGNTDPLSVHKPHPLKALYLRHWGNLPDHRDSLRKEVANGPPPTVLCCVNSYMS